MHDRKLSPFSIGLAAARALGLRGAHVVVSSRRKDNVDKAVSLLQGDSIQVTGTTCNVGRSEDRERLVDMVRDDPVSFSYQFSSSSLVHSLHGGFI